MQQHNLGTTFGQKSQALLNQWGGLLLLTLLTALVYDTFFLSRAYVSLEYTSHHATPIEMIWAGEGESYSRSNMGTGWLRVGESATGFFIGDLRKIRHLRLDPMGSTPGTVIFRKITIKQPGMEALVFDTEEDFQRFRPGRNISSLSYTESCGWTIESERGDPDLHILLDPPGKRSLKLWQEGSRFFLIVLILYTLLKVCSPLITQGRYLSLLAALTVPLVLVMASTTLYNSHPDEKVHAEAASYYEQHYLPPAIEDPAIAHTYSVYGFSRLNSPEITYMLAGKFSQIIDRFQIPDYQKYRFFNVLLLCYLVLLTFRSRPARWVFLPLLLTPQAWYIFSYYNSDAFALFVTLLIAYQLVDMESYLHRFFRGELSASKALLLLGPLLACFLLSKKNFYFFLIFAILYLFISLPQYQQSLLAVMKKLFYIVVIAGALVGIRQSLDLSVNGFNRAEKIQTVREERAGHLFKPSTELAHKHPFLHFKDRGISLSQLFTEHRWGGKVLRSFYGVYGYMTVSDTTTYYTLMQRAGFAFLLLVVLTVLLRGSWQDRLVLGSGLVCSLALIAAALYTAWTKDFQAQGRYIIVILPMIGMLLARTEQLFPPLLLRSCILFMFFLSLYNFIFVGLASPIL